MRFSAAARVMIITLCIFASARFADAQIPPGLDMSDIKFDRFEYDGFRQMLQRKSLEVYYENFSRALEQPERTILVILGDTSKLRGIEDRIYAFYKKGGALLVAKDSADDKLLYDFRTYFESNASSFPPEVTLSGYPDCPIVSDFDTSSLFEGVTSIVTNRPGHLSFRDADAQSHTAAWFPADKYGMEESFLVLRHHARSRGRLMVVADHSVFTNQMLIHGSNLKFAANVVDWLCRDGQRRRLIFIRDCEVMPEHRITNMLPPQAADELLDAIAETLPKTRPDLLDSSFREFTNNYVRTLQANDTFNFVVQKMQPPSKARFGRRAVAIVFAALLASALIVKIMMHCRAVSKVPPQSKRKDHSATLRLLIRDFFVSDNLTDRPVDARPVAVSDGWFHRRRFQRRLRSLWAIADSAVPSRTTAKQLNRYQREIARLNELRQSGQLAIQWE